MVAWLKGKIKLRDATPQLNVKIVTVLGAIAVAVVFFFAVIFALAASVQATLTRLVTSGILFVIGVTIIVGIYYTTRKPKTVIQHLEISGQMKAASIKCPNCGASVDPNQIKIVSGVPYATCPYCGTTFEVTEEPKW
jgi:DNA-directed RNA polymerase subunit RPC12/RpoP